MSWQDKSAVPPPGYAYGCTYRPSRMNMLEAAYFIVRGRPRSLSTDAMRVLKHMPAPPLLRGLDNVPEAGPLVVVANHYERPGLWMAWPAVYLSTAMRQRTGQETHWIAIQEWETLSFGRIRIPTRVIRTVFERAFRTYGILAMPPPAAPAAARASAMREAVQLVKAGSVIGLMPEGTVGPTPELLDAREGAGSFLLLLAHAGARIQPVGLYEEAGRLVAQFGAAVDLVGPSEVPKNRRDTWARGRVMCAIREQLPEPLWGVYRHSECSSQEVPLVPAQSR